MINQRLNRFWIGAKSLYHRVCFETSKSIIWFFCKLTWAYIKISWKDDCILCYDNSVSPGKFGDFWVFLSLSRMFQPTFKNVKVVVLIDGRRDSEDWRMLGVSFVESQRRLASLMFGATYAAKVNFITYSDLPKKGNILLESRVRHRRPTIRHYHALYCQLSNVNMAPIKRSDLLSNLSAVFDDIERAYISKIYKTIPTSYVCVHFRFNKEWGPDRQINFNVLDDIVDLSEKWGVTPVFVSSTECCTLVQSIGKYHNRFIFSKGVEGSNFFTDLFLAMKASIFVAYAAGGLQSFPMSSDMPFVIICKTEHESKFSFSRLFGYHGENQEHFELGSIGQRDLSNVIDTAVSRVLR